MRDAHHLASLMQRRRPHPGPEGDRPHSRHMLREYGQSIGKRGALEVAARCSTSDHRRDRSPRGRLRGRSLRSPPLDSPPSELAEPSERSVRSRGGSSTIPSGFGTSAFIDRRRRPRSSRSMSLTFTRSPFLTTSSVFSVRPCLSSEMCTRPSVPGMISTNAPNCVVDLTIPSYVPPTIGSAELLRTLFPPP